MLGPPVNFIFRSEICICLWYHWTARNEGSGSAVIIKTSRKKEVAYKL